MSDTEEKTNLNENENLNENKVVEDTNKPPKDSEENDLTNKLQNAYEKNESIQNKYLRALADIENIRKRSIDEMDKTRKYAIENFASEILLVKDSLDAAITIETATVESYKDGVELTLKQLISIFDKFNIKQIDAKNQEFDPNFHQAMTMVESEKKGRKYGMGEKAADYEDLLSKIF